MPRIRAVTYFAHVAKRFGGNVAERWFTSFTYELFAHSLVAHKLAWIRPLGYSPRVWVVSDAYVEWVHSVRGIPDIPVISSGGEQIASVNVASVIAILTAASKSTRSVARRDFATNTVMSFVLCPEGPDRPDDPLPRRARNRSQARGPDEITPVGTPRDAIAVETPPLAGRKRAHNDLGAPSVPAATGRSERGGRRLDLGWLRRQTALPADMLSLLPGNGPWTPAEVINNIYLENIRMGTEIRRLRSDIDYWREEVRLLQPESRSGDRYDRDYDRRVGNRTPHRNHRLRIVISPTIPTILTVIIPELGLRLRTKTRMMIPTGPLDAVRVRLRGTRKRDIHTTVDVR